MNTNEAELVERARDGDREAFGLLVERHWERLVRLARSVAGELVAEDAVQEGLLAAWRRLHLLIKTESFGPWVTRIVFRRCLRRRRREHRERVYEETRRPATSAATDPYAAVWVERSLAALAPRQRAVLHLTIVEGMTDGEIAPLLGITAGSVRAHRRRARERLKAIFPEKTEERR